MSLAKLIGPIVLAAAVPFAAAAQTDYTFGTLDYPGGSATTANGINDLGDIVGSSAVSGGTSGWIYSAGAFSPIYVAGAQGTSAFGVNDADEVIGFYTPSSSTSTDAFTEAGGSYATLSIPPGTSTSGFGLNDAGILVGTCAGCTGSQSSGFIDNGGVISLLNAPGDGGSTSFFGINDAGTIVGTTGTGTPFVYAGGVFTDLDVLGAIAETPYGISNDGEIVGSYTDAQGLQEGFIDNNGNFSTFDDPLGADGTVLTGVNDQGQIVGDYFDANDVEHGFVATPVQEPASVALFGTCLVGLGLVRRRSRQPRGSAFGGVEGRCPGQSPSPSSRDGGRRIESLKET